MNDANYIFIAPSHTRAHQVLGKHEGAALQPWLFADGGSGICVLKGGRKRKGPYTIRSDIARLCTGCFIGTKHTTIHRRQI